MRNVGKIFEDAFFKSVPNQILVKRLNDNTSAWSGGNNTRFSADNECDFILFDTNNRNFIALELKTTKENSLTFWREDFETKGKKQSYVIRKCQILGLEKWANYKNTICGFIINFRNNNNDTYFVNIKDFLAYTKTLDKKSINQNDILTMNPVKVENKLMRTNYKYNVDTLLRELNERM